VRIDGNAPSKENPVSHIMPTGLVGQRQVTIREALPPVQGGGMFVARRNARQAKLLFVEQARCQPKYASRSMHRLIPFANPTSEGGRLQSTEPGVREHRRWLPYMRGITTQIGSERLRPRPRSRPHAWMARPLLHSKFNEVNADLSPDGRWVVYQSDESGQNEIYARQLICGFLVGACDVPGLILAFRSQKSLLLSLHRDPSELQNTVAATIHELRR
jgi:hypothetical protein